MVLFTLQIEEECLHEINPEEIMSVLEDAIVYSLRSVDAGTRYSNSQYIVILMDTDLESAATVSG